MPGITVLVVDDSRTFLEIMRDVLLDFDEVIRVETVSSGLEAVGLVRRMAPDLVLMDLNMPSLDGMGALERMHERMPDLDVVLISGEAANCARTTIEAIERGALDFVLKPVGLTFEQAREYFVDRLSPFIRRAYSRFLSSSCDSDIPLAAPRPSGTSMGVSQGETGTAAGLDFSLVVLSVATGAPTTLPPVLSSIPKDFPLPVLAFVDVPVVFLRYLLRHIEPGIRPPLVEATNGRELQAPGIFIVSSSFRVELEQTNGSQFVSLDVDRGPDFDAAPFKADLDGLILSAAHAATGSCLFVMLSALETDGVEGITRVLSSGRHYAIVQSPGTCIAPERSRELISRGLASEVLPLYDIGARLCEIVKFRP